MPVQIKAKLISKKELVSGIFHFQVEAPEIVKTTKPGHFVEVRVSNQTAPFLRRPISIHQIHPETGILEFIFQIKGEGTKILAEKQVGDEIDIIGPLGFGTFNYQKYSNIAVIGGGIGIFPLYELCKQAKQAGKQVSTYLSFRNKDLVVLEDEFKNVSNELSLSTDDGSYSKKGFALEYLKEDCKNQNYDCIFACGPTPMLRAIKSFAEEAGIPCQVSLEEKMGCGLGACLGCAVKISSSPKDAPDYMHVCKTGPVFNASDVEF